MKAKKGIKRLFGSFFLFLDWFLRFRLFGNRPTLQKTLLLRLQNLREEAFSTFTLHNTPYWVDERERRGLQWARDGKSKTRGCVSSVVRSKEREREAVLPHTTTSRDWKWEKTWNLACGSTWKKRNEGKWYRAWRKRRRWWRRWRKTTSTWASACGSQICWISARARTRKRQRWRIRLTFTCKGWRGWRKLRDERFYRERERDTREIEIARH